MFEQYLWQLAPYTVLTVAVIFAGCLSSSLKRYFRRVVALRRDLDQAVAEIEQLKQSAAENGLRLQDAEERAGVLVPPPPLQSGMNVNRRTQVIRMCRRGDRPESIAASLNLPRGEVELLLKVHRMAVDGRLPGKTSQE